MDGEEYTSLSGRNWDVQYQNWKTNIVVCTSGTDERLYVLNAAGCRDLTIIKGSDQPIGSSIVHQWSSRIDVETKDLYGASNTFELRNDSILGGSPRYTSPAFDGQSMTWKNKAMSTKILYTLLDGQAMAIAHFESSPKTKIGKLEIVDAVVEDHKINEIVVTLLTLLYRKLRTIETNTIVAITA